MAKPRSPKLKVYQAQFGFYDTVVAAPNQGAALRAWGTHQNLFATGEAKPTTDEAATRAALAEPETPLRRPVGSLDPFEREPAHWPTLPPAPRRAGAKRPAKPAPPPKPPADRSALDAAEAALGALDAARGQEEAALRRRRAELDEADAAARRDYTTRRKAALAAVEDARRAYRDAGGKA